MLPNHWLNDWEDSTDRRIIRNAQQQNRTGKAWIIVLDDGREAVLTRFSDGFGTAQVGKDTKTKSGRWNGSRLVIGPNESYSVDQVA